MTEIREWVDQVPTAAVATVATLAVLLLASLFIRAKVSRRPRKRLPPGPRGWPILGSLPLLGPLPNQSYQKLAKQYGPFMFLRLGSVNAVVVSSSEMAEEVLRTHDKVLASRPEIVAAKHMFYNRQDIGFGPYGPLWRYMRKVVTVGLLTVHRLAEFQEIREKEVLAALHFILEESERGNAVNMTDCFTTITLNNITQMLMNKRYSVLNSSASKSAETSTSLPEIFREAFTLLGSLNIADFLPFLKPFDPQGAFKRVKVLHKKVDKFLDEILEEHRQRPSAASGQDYKEDFVDALLGVGQTKDLEEPLSEDVMKALILDMLIGASDTSATQALWVLTELIRHPVAMRKAQEELDSVVGQQRLVREDDLPQLKYMTAVFKETMRMHSSSGPVLNHESMEDCEIAGYHIPAGTRIIVNIWGIHRDPAKWENPTEFNPDRFMNSEFDFTGRDLTYFPFGAGRRSCPGKNLGLLMVLYKISALVHAIDWIIPNGQKPEDVDISQQFGIVLYKRLPLMMFGKARLPKDVIYGTRKVQN